MNLKRLRLILLLYIGFDFLLGYAGMVPITELAAAQFTTVTGTVTDPNGLPYANGTIVPILVIPSGAGSPTLSGAGYAPPIQPTGLDKTGSFTMNLADNTVLQPAGTKWNFTVCSAGGTIQPAGGKGPVCFSLAAPITISGSSQSISANLNAVALALSGISTAGVTGGNPVALTGATVSGGLNTTQLAVPSGVIATCNGACAGGTWTYKVQAIDVNGYLTTPSSAASATNATTLTTTNKNVITWNAVTNAISYNVTRTVSAGTPANLSVVCVATTLLTCTDDGSVNTASVTLATGNSTGGIKFPICPAGSSINFNVANMTLSDGTLGNGICFTANGMFFTTPTHVPAMYLAQATVNKWSHHIAWSPNGQPPEVAIGVTIQGDIGRGFDSQPGMFDVGWNDAVDDSSSFVAAAGYSKIFTATAALTAGQVVKVDSANPSAVVVTVTTDTAAGIPIGIVLDSPGAAGIAYVLTNGVSALPILGTGTCSIGNFVIVDTTTNGRVKCTATYTAGTIIGYAMTAQAAVGSAVTVMVQPK
jgi:hypothetical protein